MGTGFDRFGRGIGSGFRTFHPLNYEFSLGDFNTPAMQAAAGHKALVSIWYAQKIKPNISE